MVTQLIYIKEENYEAAKSFIRSLKTARFKQNPYKTGKKYCLNITFDDVEDSNKFSQFLEEKEYSKVDTDNPKLKTAELQFNKTFKKLFNLFTHGK